MGWDGRIWEAGGGMVGGRLRVGKVEEVISRLHRREGEPLLWVLRFYMCGVCVCVVCVLYVLLCGGVHSTITICESFWQCSTKSIIYTVVLSALGTIVGYKSASRHYRYYRYLFTHSRT